MGSSCPNSAGCADGDRRRLPLHSCHETAPRPPQNPNADASSRRPGSVPGPSTVGPSTAAPRPPAAAAPRRGRSDPGRRRDGHDAVRSGSPVRRSARGLEPRPPDVVRRIHRGYLDAGSRILLTNTFGGNRLRLALHGHERRVDEFNRTAAILLRAEVDAAGGTALVAGDIGPTGEIMAPLGTLDEDDAVDAFAEQAAALIAGGVDLIWIETMSDLEEIQRRDRGRPPAPGIPIIATMTFDTRGRTMMGVSPEQAVGRSPNGAPTRSAATAATGPTRSCASSSGCTRPRRRALVAKSNAGMPVLVDMRAVYRPEPGHDGRPASTMRDAGARIVGAAAAARRHQPLALDLDFASGREGELLVQTAGRAARFTWMRAPTPWDSMRLAVLTVSPQRS